MSRLTTDYSGVVLEQSDPPEGVGSVVTGTVYQDFFLPDDYVRGPDASNAVIPDLTGLQIYVTSASTDETVTWALEEYDAGVGWTSRRTGSITELPVTGEQWITIFFDDALPLSLTSVESRFRMKFVLGDVDAYYSAPNPLAFNRAYTDGDPTLAVGASPVLDTSREVSLLFRVLASTTDSDVDFLGNRYRSAAVSTIVDNVSTNAGSDIFWLSKPNPSRFAVETLCFDMRDEGVPVVIDRVLIDPVTPNVVFHVYYSNDDVDPTDYTDDQWDNLLWTRVPFTFHARRRETHALPRPISASFVKIEFSHLQAKPYNPGNFQKPVVYKKHPKWVLDYFLLRAEADRTSDDRFVAGRVRVTFDALDLAYNYYLDDLRQEPISPIKLINGADNVKNFMTARNDVSDYVDTETMLRIRTTFDEFAIHPGLFSKTNYLPSVYAGPQGLAEATTYPAEQATPSLVYRGSDVSGVNREPVLFEQDFPLMFFFIDCRHTYRKVLASLSHGRAYFVGIREIQFDRDQYSSEIDTRNYIERLDDTANTSVNDFLAPRESALITRTAV